ncbi:unnamed protein product [Microthlaspi erraticum]|uniref:Endonuclease/exonuclease/phosphatase domain-containing protein n=1 Tax=Microthlaspi erraticum TaxID=1685480 RepID=A0A6D2HF07_9BRAS|nr:unnamed protein product [Microthlaspi erraticum]
MYIDIFCWNVRGFNKLSHRSGFKKWLSSSKPIFGGLIETHVQQPKNVKFINNLFPGWLFDDNYEFSTLGKIWIVWHPSVKVQIITKSLQMISCEVTLPGSDSSMIFSFIYAANLEVLRNELWEELISLSTDTRVVGKAWAVLGDFNQVLHPNEHSSLDGFTVDRATRDFRQALLNSELADLNFRGSTYTWWNKRSVNPVAKKLDRVLVNDLWLEIFPTAMAFFGAPDFSDHSSTSIALSPSTQRQKKAFKFYNYLLENPDFIAVICSEWFSLNFVGSDMFRVSKKLKALKKTIRDLVERTTPGWKKESMKLISYCWIDR